jgi:hypothetical protein
MASFTAIEEALHATEILENWRAGARAKRPRVSSTFEEERREVFHAVLQHLAGAALADPHRTAACTGLLRQLNRAVARNASLQKPDAVLC